MLAGLRAYLLEDATVEGMVDARVYPLNLPQKPTYPAITYNQVSGVRDWTLCGPADWARIRVQFDCWAKDYSTVHDLADAVRRRLQAVQVTLGDSPEVSVGSIRLDNEFDSPFESEAGTVGVYRVVQDYIISHEEN